MLVPAARRAALRRRLLAWYGASRRELPWRRPAGEADPYRVWLSEVMLQQTQVRTAIPYYRRFTARFPTLDALAAASDDEVLALWSGLGYYARGRNLLRAAREARARHGGLPRSVEALRALSGVGAYTAGAVASIAFGVPVPAVDGNAARVLARLFAIDGDPGSARVRARMDALAAALLDPARPGDWNQALMELGATLCTPAPSCGACPAAPLCAARRAGRERELPRPRRRPAARPLLLACALVQRRGAVLLARRPPRGLFGGLWAPPAVEVAPGADPRAALARSLRERHGVRSRIGEELAACERKLTHRLLTLRAFACDVRPAHGGTGALRWARLGELDDAGVPAAVRALLARVPPGPRADPRPQGGESP